MLGLFGTLKKYASTGAKAGKIELEGFVSRLSYRVTCVILLACCILVSAREWVGNDRKIVCAMEGPQVDWKISPNVINSYCYIMATFTVPRQAEGKQPHPGVGPYNPKVDEISYRSYYQWVPMFLFLQSILFYCPHLLLKIWEGGKVASVMCGLNNLLIDREDRRKKQVIFANYFVDNLNSHNIWAVKILLCKLLSLANILFNMYFIDVFLDGQFSTYGLRVTSLLDEDPLTRVDPMSHVFPRMTKCIFRKFGPSGDIQNHDSLCVLPINIINEKIFVFLWFWLIFLFVVTGLSVLYNSFVVLIPPVRNFLLKVQAGRMAMKANIFRDITPHLQVGDWKLLHILGSNMEPLVFGELIEQVAARIKEKDKPIITPM